MSKLPTVHILYENPAWLPPLVEGLEREGFNDIRMAEKILMLQISDIGIKDKK